MNRTLDSSGIHRIYEFVVSRPVDVRGAVLKIHMVPSQDMLHNYCSNHTLSCS